MSFISQRVNLKLIMLLLLLIVSTIGTTYFLLEKEWLYAGFCVAAGIYILNKIHTYHELNTKKIAFMFDAIDNSDYAFKYATGHLSTSDSVLNASLNRIIQILLQAKADTIQKEKYYEFIINSVNTGIIVIDNKGSIFQTNSEALHLLGISVFTHVRQLEKIDEGLAKLITEIQPGEKRSITFTNERSTMHLSIRVSDIMLKDNHVRILAINDIKNELDDKEIDSWMRLTRVLTHEIMNSVTPITSLSDTLLSMHKNANKDIRNGLETISYTGKSLISFVESYRKFTHIPTPSPSLFYVVKFAERMKQLARHQNNYPQIRIIIDIQPDDLIIFADENLITQVVLNLLKNAMEAIGEKQENGMIRIKVYCDKNENIIMEITNNGPYIPPEEAEQIFVPFFTTKEGGSGVGLSISRQIMRISGGSLTLRSDLIKKETTFTLTFS